MTSSDMHEKADTRIIDEKPAKHVRIKRCPDCYCNISMNETQCPSCKRKLKLKIDQNGYAKRPVNWSAYISCFMAWVGAVIYIWWAFFKD